MPKEKESHRHLDAEMRSEPSAIDKDVISALFQEASAQLAEVLLTTQQATENIMDIVERCMDAQSQAVGMLNALRERLCVLDTPSALNVPNALDILDCIAVWNHGLGADFSDIMTALSFQDITGQRVKKAVEALTHIEGILTGREQTSHNDALLREADACETVLQTKAGRATRPRTSKLKGPTKGVSQTHIDRLLAQLGKD